MKKNALHLISFVLILMFSLRVSTLYPPVDKGSAFRYDEKAKEMKS